MLFYFIPTERKTDCPPELLEEFLLDKVLDEPRIAPVRRGPDGRPGLVLVDKELSAQPIPYLETTQTWRQSIETDAWIGHNGDTPPKPSTLARKNQLPGRPVKTNAGDVLTIPIARRYIEVEGVPVPLPTNALPQSYGRDPESKAWVPKETIAKYRPLWAHLCAYIDAEDAAIFESTAPDDEPIFFHYDGVHELAIAAINANYRLNHDELEILGIYDDELRDAVIATLKDQKTLEALLKKKRAALASDSSTSSDGPADSTPESTRDTDQPSPK